MFSVSKNIFYFYIFKKIVLTQRDDKEDIAKSHACEIIAVREMMDLKKHEYKKLKWKMY